MIYHCVLWEIAIPSYFYSTYTRSDKMSLHLRFCNILFEVVRIRIVSFRQRMKKILVVEPSLIS